MLQLSTLEMPPKFANSGKVLLLSKLIENRALLFEKFDESKGITKDRRKAKWNEIHGELKALGYPVGNDGDYLRDTTFSNLKKRTLVSKL